MASLPPRSYANNRNLAAKPTKASNTDQGYLMRVGLLWYLNSTVAYKLGQTRPWEPRCQTSHPKSPRHRSRSFRLHHRLLPAPPYHAASPLLITHGSIGSSPEIQPTINTHRPRHTPAA